MTDPNETSVGAIEAPTCKWCGLTLDEHEDTRPSWAPSAKTPCGLLKSRFAPEKARDAQ